MAEGKLVRSKMAQAFINSLDKSLAHGANPGKVGAQIRRNIHSGVGVIWRERLTLKKQQQPTAETAENRIAA